MARVQKGGSARPLLMTALLGGVAVLSLINWHLYSTAVDISLLSPPTRQVDAKEARDHELATPLDDKPQIVFEETVQRPLFHADRKPIERTKEVVEGPAPAALNTGMQLVGIVKSGGAPGRALIRFAGEPIGKWVPEGETVNGWHRASVKTSSVVLEGNGQTHELQLPLPARSAGGEGGERPNEAPKRKTR
jgi:hypothetical protein